MAELRVALDEILPIKEAARGLARVLDRLEHAETQHIVITRRSKPRAVVVAVERYEALLRAEASAS